MGMSIDEAMENLHAIQAYYNDDIQDGYIGFAKEDDESVDVAIDTMRKYQKIEQIAFPLQFCTTDELNHEAIMKICEVLKDGNDD